MISLNPPTAITVRFPLQDIHDGVPDDGRTIVVGRNPLDSNPGVVLRNDQGRSCRPVRRPCAGTRRIAALAEDNNGVRAAIAAATTATATATAVATAVATATATAVATAVCCCHRLLAGVDAVEDQSP